MFCASFDVRLQNRSNIRLENVMPDIRYVDRNEETQVSPRRASQRKSVASTAVTVKAATSQSQVGVVITTPKMVDLLDYSGRSWRDCKEIKEKEITPQKPSTSNAQEHETIRLLPRKDFSMYGEFPKVDTKVLIECNKCGTVLLPCSFQSHCSKPDHDKMADLLDYSGRSWRDCKDIIGKEVTTQKPSTSNALEYKTIRLLPRKDFSMYGEFPKVDAKVLIECDKCGTVLLPCRFQSHCSNPDHDKLASSTSSGSKQTASHKNSKPSYYIPPGGSLLKKKYQQPKNKKKSGLPPPVPLPTLFAKTALPPSAALPPAEKPVILQSPGKPCSPPQLINSVSSSITHSSSGKHKKNKKSAKRSKDETEKVDKTEKSDKVEKAAAAETREGREPRENRETNTVPKVVTAVIIVSARKESSKAARKESNKVKEPQNSTHDSITEAYSNRIVKPSKDSSTSSTNRCVPPFVINQPQVLPIQQKQIDVLQPLQVVASPNKAQDTINNNQSSIVYMPMSPVAVVNNVPVQFIKLPLIRVASTQPLLSPPLTSQPIVVTIPIQNSTTPMYSSHPKPLSVTTRGIRKIGSTYLLQNQRIYHQRSEIQSMTNTRRSIANSCSTLNTFHHRPNILKNSAKSNVKVTVKRASSEKLMNDNNKHIRLNDVNGFILHADVSESAEAPLHNNSVHDKVTFLNMK